jgi:hypothetical protein
VRIAHIVAATWLMLLRALAAAHADTRVRRSMRLIHIKRFEESLAGSNGR